MQPVLEAFADGTSERLALLDHAAVPPGAISLVLVGLLFGHLESLGFGEQRQRVLEALEAALPKLLQEQRRKIAEGARLH
jgi:hypothetical protein